MKKFLLLFIFVFPLFVFSQPVQLFERFNGRYDFTAFGNTLSTAENNGGGNPCILLPQSSASLSLTLNQTIVSAHLYWASVGNGDFDVALNGTPISAQRTFSHNFQGLPYFAAYADVTNLITTIGSGNYTFSGMDIPQATLNQYCGSTNFGGWAIYVIYEDPSLLLNQINIYDGLESVSANNQNLTITIDGIDITSDRFSKIGFLAWEGDLPNPVGEDLELRTINGSYFPSNALNPRYNNFNSTNSYTGSTVSYQMDLDYYDLENIVPPIIQPGVTSIDVILSSGQDYIMVNNIITSVNSELPDATIEIDNIGLICENGDMDVEYTVYNTNSTNELPANTPIAIYADDGVNPRALLAQTATVNEIPIGGSESGTVTVSLPGALPNNFNLIAVVDDIGSGMNPPQGIVAEIDETNNEFFLPVDKSNQIILINPGPACLGAPVILDSGLTNPPYTEIHWFRNGILITSAEDDTELVVTTDGIYTVQAFNGACEVNSFANPVVITFRPQPIANPAPDMKQCDFGTTNGTFLLTDQDPYILGGQDPLDFQVRYFETLALAQAGVPGTEILGGVKIIDPPSPETIWARIEDRTGGGCYDLTDFEIYFSRAVAGAVS
ncbi:hypothetical protein F3C99_02150, partial [Vitellibacter sp. q18]|nr:hypothetical protein [Aequorivita lutea]